MSTTTPDWAQTDSSNAAPDWAKQDAPDWAADNVPHEISSAADNSIIPTSPVIDGSSIFPTPRDKNPDPIVPKLEVSPEIKQQIEEYLNYGGETGIWERPTKAIVPPAPGVAPKPFDPIQDAVSRIKPLVVNDPSGSSAMRASRELDNMIVSAVTTPLWDRLPDSIHVAAEEMFPHVYHQDGQPLPPQDAETQMIGGAFRAGGNVLKSFTSPIGLLTLGMGGLPATAQKVISLAFAVDMARKTPEIFSQLGTEYGKPENERDYGKIGQLMTEGVLNTGLAAMAGAHGLATGEVNPLMLSKEAKVKFVTRQLAKQLSGQEVLTLEPEQPPLSSGPDFFSQMPAAKQLAPKTAEAVKETVAAPAPPVESKVEPVVPPKEPVVSSGVQANPGDKVPKETTDSEGFKINPEGESFLNNLPYGSLVSRRDGDVFRKNSDGGWDHQPDLQIPGNKSIDQGTLGKGSAALSGGEVIRVGDGPTAPKNDWRITVQSPQMNGQIPGYVQIDEIKGQENVWSKSPATLAKEGVQVPDFSKLPQGQYTYGQAVELLRASESQPGSSADSATSEIPQPAEAAATPAPPVASKPVKAKGVLQQAREFDKLLLDYAPHAEWTDRTDTLLTPVPESEHLGTMGIKARIAQKQELAKARAQAIRQIGGDPYQAGKPAYRAEMLEKFRAALAEKFPKQTQDFKFSEDTKPEAGKVEVPSNEVSVGDVLVVKGENVKVTNVDPDGDVELEDGTKYGHQVLQDGSHIYAEEWHKSNVDTSFAGDETTPKLGAMEQGTGDLLKGQNEDFALVGEKGSDAERIAAEKSKAEQSAKEAADLEKKQQPEMIGMGGARPSEFENSGGNQTSIKNAKVDQERKDRGLPPAMQVAKRSFGDVWAEAMAKIDKAPEYQDNLIKELRKNPRSLTDVEDAVLLHRQIDLQNEYGKATRDLAQAYDDGRAEAVQEEKLRVAGLSDKLLDLYNIGKKVGTETGRGLNARKMLVNEDFTLASMEVQKRAANDGRPLSEQQQQEIKELHDKIQKTQQAYDDYIKAANERISKLEADKKLAEIAASTKPKFDKRILDQAERIVSKMEDAAKDADKRLMERLGRVSVNPFFDLTLISDLAIVGSAKIARKGLSLLEFTDEMIQRYGEKIRPIMQEVWDASNAMVDKVSKGVPDQVKRAIREKSKPDFKKVATDAIKEKVSAGKKGDISYYVQKLARGFVESGITDRDALIDAVHEVVKEVIPDITRRETMDAISGYGDFKQLSKDEVSVQLRDLKGQMQQIGKLEDMSAGKAPQKSGLERAEMSDEQRRLVKQVEEAKRRGGFTVTDPATQLKSALQARKTYYTNRIADLQHEILTRERIVKSRSPSPTDAQLDALRSELEKVKAQHDEIFKKPDLTDEQRIQIASRSLSTQIAELERQLRTGEIFPSEKALKTPKSAILDAKRARLDALKEERQWARDALQPQSEVAAKEQERLAAALDSRIKKIQEEMARGEVFPKGAKAPAVESPENQARRAKLKELQDERQWMRESLQPRPFKSKDEIALQSFKTRTAGRIAELSEKIARGDFSSKRASAPIELDPEAVKLKAENERLKQQFKDGVLKDRLKNRTPLEKTMDALVKWRRAFILSSPVTLAKLTSAAIIRMTVTPIEEAVGAGISKVIPGVAKRAPREGGASVMAESKALTEGFTKGMSDAWQTLTTGKSPLDVLYGKHNAMPRSWLDFFGNLHGALKAVTKRNEFARSFEKRAQFLMENGVDVSDPLVQTKIAVEAYKDANRSIFLQDNRVVSAWKRGMSSLEEKSKITGEVPVGSKALATVGKILFPIVKIPSNIVAETMQYAVGSVTGSARLANAFRKGIETLPPDQADLIMRELKKGSLGAAALVFGYFYAKNVGGFYHGKQREGETPYGAVKIGDMEIPAMMLHNPYMETFQIGATVRQVAESKLRKKDGSPQGLAAGVWAGALGLTEEVPFIKEMTEIAKAYDPNSRGAFLGELGKSLVVPQVFDWTARQMDKNAQGDVNKRNPQTMIQHIETGIPGLRKNVPLKK